MAYKYLGLRVPADVARCGATSDFDLQVAEGVRAQGGSAGVIRREPHIHSGEVLETWRVESPSDAALIKLFGPAVYRAANESLVNRASPSVTARVLAEIRVLESRGNGKSLQGARRYRLAPGEVYSGMVDAETGRVAFGRDVDNTPMDFSPVLSWGPKPDRPLAFEVAWADRRNAETDALVPEEDGLDEGPAWPQKKKR